MFKSQLRYKLIGIILIALIIFQANTQPIFSAVQYDESQSSLINNHIELSQKNNGLLSEDNEKTNVAQSIYTPQSSLITIKQQEESVIDDVYGNSNYLNKNLIIVKFKDKDENKKIKIKNEVKDKLNLTQLEFMKELKYLNADVLQINKVDNPNKIIDEFNKYKDVEYAQINYKVNLLSTSLKVENTVSETVYNKNEIDIYSYQMPSTINEDTSKSQLIKVGIIDTEIDINHEYFDGYIYNNLNEIPENGIDDDNNGYIDDVNGWDFYNDDKTVIDDVYSQTHGTYVTEAIINEINSGIKNGLDSQIEIIPLKFSEDGSGFTLDIIDAIEYAEKQGASIINANFSSSYYNPALKDAIEESDITFIVAAGDDSKDLDKYPIYPASYDCDNIIVVGSKNEDDEISDFSNYGDNTVDEFALGEDIISSLFEDKYGYISGSSIAAASVTGQKAVTESVEVYSLEELQAKYLSIMKELKSFTNILEEDRRVIEEFLKVDFNLLLEAESKGYSIGDSILIAKILTDYNFNYKEIQKLQTFYEDLIEVFSQSEKYINLTNRLKVSDRTKDGIRQAFVAGYKIRDIEKASIIADVLDAELLDIIHPSDKMVNLYDLSVLNNNYSKLDIEKLKAYLSKNCINVQWYLNYIEENDKNIKDIYFLVEKYYDNILNASEKNRSIENQQLNQKDTYSISNTSAEEDDYKAPFSYKEYNEDKVEINSGNLIYENVDLYLSGKNGLDLSIISRYDLSEDICGELEVKYSDTEATYYDLEVTVDYYENGIPRGIGSHVDTIEMCSHVEYERYLDLYDGRRISEKSDDINEVYIFSVSKIRMYDVNGQFSDTQCWFQPTYNQKVYPIGKGWSFNFDSIEIVEDDDYYNEFLDERCYFIKKTRGEFLHLADGRKYKIKMTSTQGDSNLEGYKLKDIRLELDSSFTNSQNITSKYVLIEKDGIRKYFADDGRLLAKKDRYDNCIEFNHTLIKGHPVITKIIDTLKREINIDYDYGNNQIVISGPNDIYIKYILDKDGFRLNPNTSDIEDLYKIIKIIDSEGRETKFEYESDTVLYYVLDSFRGMGWNKNYLKKVVYPTGGYTQYEYEKSRRFLPDGGFESYYRVKKRNLIDTSNSIDNLKEYIYENNYTKYPYKKTDSFEIYNPQYYRFITMEDAEDETCIEYEFSYKNLLQSKVLFNTLFTSYDSNNFLVDVRKNIIFEEYSYDYDNYYLANEVIKKKYNQPKEYSYNTEQDRSKYLLMDENYEHDDYGNVTRYWGTQNPQGINYIYDTDYYNLLKEKQYQKDRSSSIREIFNLSADHKSISEKIIKENNQQKSKTHYLYDQWGNMINKKSYFQDDNWSDYVEVEYDYTDNNQERDSQYDFSGTYLTNKTINGMLDADGNQLNPIEEKYKYDDLGNLIKSWDGNDELTEYQYDRLGRTTKIYYPTDNPSDSISEERLYNDLDNNLTIIDTESNEIRYEYDSLGNLLRKVDVISGQSLLKYSYDNNLRLETESNINSSLDGYKTEYCYYPDGRLEYKETRDKDRKLLYREDYEYIDAVDLNGDGLAEESHIIRTIKGDTDGASKDIKTVEVYDVKGNLIKEKIYNDKRDSFEVVSYEYDYLGNKVGERSRRHNSNNWTKDNTITYEYDYAGRVTRSTDIYNDEIEKEYDAIGRLISETDSKGNKKEYEYDSAGRRIKEITPFEELDDIIYSTIKKNYYDNNHNLITEKITSNKPDEEIKYNQTDYGYNERNELIFVKTYDNYGQPENYTQYYYDNLGNVLRMYTGLSQLLNITGLDRITENGDSDYSITRYSYDRFSRLTNIINPLEGEESYTYDLNATELEKVDPNGNTVITVSDGFGRTIEETILNSSQEIVMTNTADYTLTGEIKSQDGDNGETTYQYNSMGLLEKITENGGITKEYQYDENGNRTSLILKHNSNVVQDMEYQYDKKDRLEYVYNESSLVAHYTYDENGNRSTLEYGNGVLTRYKYNLSNNLKELTNKIGDTVISQYSYTHYLDGNQASKFDGVDEYNYTYDALGRITEVVKNDETINTYTYDDYNNRESMTTLEGATQYVYDKGNRLIEEINTIGDTQNITRYNYDNNGNQIYKSTETLEPQREETESLGAYIREVESEMPVDVSINKYNELNQLVESISNNNTAKYTYNNNGLRISKSVNGITTEYIWDGNNIALELDNNRNITVEYIRGINLISRERTNENPEYYLYNGHGDVVQLTDTDGVKTKEYDYDIFGNEINQDLNDTNPFRYSGEYYDKETGTYYLRARYYDPSIGRFISEDSFRGKHQDPMSLNLYTYCGNNPIRYIDPSGHFWAEIWGGIKSVTRAGIHTGDWAASEVFGIDTASIGAFFLDMWKDSSGVYHANFDCWQANFGYNDSYDFFFDMGTSMTKAKFQFKSGGQDYILWAWKGDYINLGAGAELGIYKRMTVAGYDTPQWAVDKSLAMTMTLNLKDNKGNTIISYAPNDKQWWITGFNPNSEYKNFQASSLTASYTVNFNTKTMYNDFYNIYGQGKTKDDRWTFDPKTYKATFKF